MMLAREPQLRRAGRAHHARGVGAAAGVRGWRGDLAAVARREMSMDGRASGANPADLQRNRQVRQPTGDVAPGRPRSGAKVAPSIATDGRTRVVQIHDAHLEMSMTPNSDTSEQPRAINDPEMLGPMENLARMQSTQPGLEGALARNCLTLAATVRKLWKQNANLCRYIELRCPPPTPRDDSAAQDIRNQIEAGIEQRKD